MASIYTIKNALHPDPTASLQNRKYNRVDLRLENGRISQIAPGGSLSAEGEVIDAKDMMVLPGFINAHTHSIEMWTRGLVEPIPLEIWLAGSCSILFVPISLSLDPFHCCSFRSHFISLSSMYLSLLPSSFIL